MWAVLFEVTPKPDRWDAYLAHAASLRPALLTIDGFIDNRRFASRGRPGTLLSLSYWRDESALIAWRTHQPHRAAQTAGRAEVFQNYRLRVGPVETDPTRGTRWASVIESPSSDRPPDGADADLFDGVTVPGQTLMLLTWRAGLIPTGGRDVAIARDYGLHERAEAPPRQ